MGGFLAEPAIFYPSVFPADGLFGRYPYLLPNLVSVIVIVVAIIQGIFFLEETNPGSSLFHGDVTADADEDDAVIDNDSTVDERTPLSHSHQYRRPRISAIENRPVIQEEGLPTVVEQNFDIRRTSFSTVHSIRLVVDPQVRPPLPRTKSKQYTGSVFNFTIIMLTLSLVLMAYHQMAFWTLFPTHLLDKPAVPHGQLDRVGGLGLTIHDVGIYLSINGVLGLFIQGLIFPVFVDRVGVWHSFLISVVLFPLAYLVMPFLSALPPVLQSGGIYLSMVLQSFFSIISLPTGLILLKNATPSPTVLGRVNGLAMSACCFARTIAPPVAGIIYAAGGSASAWFSCAGVGVLGMLQLFWVPREHIHDVIVEANVLRKTLSHSEVGERIGEHDVQH
ncbi:MFS general substrate transporter [Xylariaceae sp. FL0594]|nr:MFS general substrate transporter [Xylariaceae sp. FL0594]